MIAKTASVTILLVEDDLVDIKKIKRLFNERRIANPVIVAHNGLEALEVLRGNEETPPLGRPFMILMDINMPRMNGIEFLKELRADEQIRDAIVFVLTTSDNDQDKSDAYRYNVAGYILKHDFANGFDDAVQLLSAYWRVIELPVNPLSTEAK